MKRIFTLLFVLSGVMMMNSCEEDLSDTNSVLQIKMLATNKSFPVLRSTTPTFSWEVCTMRVSEIEFEAEGKKTEGAGESYEVSYEWRGAKVIDLFDPSSVIGNITLDPGVYEEIEMEIHASRSQDATAPVFYLAGNYTNTAGTVVPVEIVIDEDFQFEVEQEGMSLNGTFDYSALVNFNLALLMDGISDSELDAATLTDGKLVISAASNQSLYQKIKENSLLCGEVEYEHEYEHEHEEED